MKRLLLGWVIIVLLLGGGPGVARGGILYGANGHGGNPSTLYTIDSATGAATAIGPIVGGGNQLAISGLAFDVANGKLYGATAPQQQGGGLTNELVIIDPKTGAATLIGGLGRAITDLTFDPSTGTMFGWEGKIGGNSLVSINLTTGAANQIGFSGIVDAGAGLASNSGGTLFLVPGSSSGPLDTVNKTTGAVNMVATLSGAPNSGPMFALTFDDHNTLFGINNGFLVTINTTTGAMTNHGQVPSNLDALAFAPSPAMVPEPGSLTLLGIGSVGLAFWGWHRRKRFISEKR